MLFLLSLWLAAAPSFAQTEPVGRSTAAINVLYPPEGYVHPAARGAQVMGWVAHPEGKLRINGQEVKVHPAGGFLGYVPIVPGSVTFHCELELAGGATAFDRAILVAQPLKADSTTQTVIDPDSIQPAEDVELRPGGWLTVSIKGTPGGQAQFQIKKKRKLPMAETNPSLGIYRGAYQVQPGDSFEGAPVYFYLTGPNRSDVWAEAKGRLTVKDDLPPVAVVRSTAPVNVRADRGAAFILFAPTGTRFLTAGREGSEVKLWLGPSATASAPAGALRFLPPGTPPPRAVLSTIRTEVGVDSTTVVMSVNETVPFTIEPGASPDSLTVRFFYTVDHTNWIIYDPADSFVREIRWRQADAATAAVVIRLSPSARLWGYETRWEGGALRLGLRHPPKLAAGGSPLKGRAIVVDAGHMPSAPGAFGPRGTLEKDVNLGIAKALEALLLAAGAKPIMTRSGDDEVGLSDRPRMVRERRGELFISVHNNALPDGADPFERPSGFSIFYNQPHSFELAAAVHRSYQRNIPLPDEGLRYGDLLVARFTDVPAILTESAYIIHPEQEALLASPTFQKRLAKAIFEGVRDFLEAERARQAATPSRNPARRTETSGRRKAKG